MHISVTIGRNVDDQPMASAFWQFFRLAVLENLAPLPTTTTYQMGTWDGVEEESATISGEVEDFDPDDWANLARRYKQDAIAVLVGDSPHWQLVFSDHSPDHPHIEKGWAR